MSILQAIILGIIQGLSEFIPISSTAHLTIAGKIMGLIDPMHPDQWTHNIAIMQIGTLIAVLVYFRNDIINISTSFFKENFTKEKRPILEQSNDSKMAYYIIVGTIPIVVIGLAFKDFIESSFTKDLIVIAFSLIILAIILAYADTKAKLVKDITKIRLKDAFLIGLAQCLALIPGASRSGTTITAGLFLGLNRETAARFSFLLSIPAILASGLLSAYSALKFVNPADALALIVAMIVAGVSGYLSIAFLLRFLRTKTTLLFVVYRIALGLLILISVYGGFIGE